jgi:hypothetical protein
MISYFEVPISVSGESPSKLDYVDRPPSFSATPIFNRRCFLIGLVILQAPKETNPSILIAYL